MNLSVVFLMTLWSLPRNPCIGPVAFLHEILLIIAHPEAGPMHLGE